MNAATAVCAAVVSLTRAEYEAVRADGLRFFIAEHHENPELDLLVVEHERYSIVAKLPGSRPDRAELRPAEELTTRRRLSASAPDVSRRAAVGGST